MKGIAVKIYHLFHRLGVQTRKFPGYVRNFGLKVAFYILIDRLFPPGRSMKYRRVIYQYLESEFIDIVEKYKIDGCENSIAGTSAKIIWVCWFQGEDNMPELVRMCYNNLKNKIKGSDIKLILLTHENIDKYVEIPDYIKEKYHKGIISHAHYSDILRFKILRKYGGCWVDSTIFVTTQINEDLFGKKFNTLKMRPNLCPSEPCMGLWSGFFIIGRNDLPLFCFISDCLNRYWKSHSIAIDYIMFDYIMLLAYRNNSDVKMTMDAVPYNNEELWYLWNNIEKPFSEALYQEICNKGQFYKLSYQKALKKRIDGKLTVYGYLTSKR